MQVLTVVVGLLGALMSTVKAAAVDTTAAAINTTTTAPLRICATYYSDGAFDQLPAYANGHYENAEDFAHITSFWNLDCGFCIVFEYVYNWFT